MKNKELNKIEIYESPDAQILIMVSESVLCSSVQSSVTGDTGVFWTTGEDAEW